MNQVVKTLTGTWPDYAVNLDVRKQWVAKWGYVKEL